MSYESNGFNDMDITLDNTRVHVCTLAVCFLIPLERVPGKAGSCSRLAFSLKDEGDLPESTDELFCLSEFKQPHANCLSCRIKGTEFSLNLQPPE